MGAEETLQLWQVSTPDSYEPWWHHALLFWASGYERACEMGRDLCDRHFDSDLECVVDPVAPDWGTVLPRRPYPHEETRDNVARLCGLGELDETPCGDCGLYAMGMDAYRVCDDCGLCRECGCECPAKEGE